MTKTKKRFLLITILTLLFTLVAGIFTACGGNTDSTITYTVTVKTDETTFAQGVRVALGKGGASFGPKTTDANGKAEFTLAPDDYTISLSKLPEGYSVAAGTDLTLTPEKRDLVVTLEEAFAYKVYLVNENGTPYYAAGVMVGICTLEGNCLTPVSLGADGLALCPAQPGDYHVQILGLPDTVTFDKDENGYYTGKNFSATDTEMTITIKSKPAAEEVTAKTPMTAAEKTEYAKKNPNYTPDNALLAYHFEKELAVGETAYYSITPTIGGDYRIYKDENASYLYNDTTFQTGNAGNGLYSAFPVLRKGTTYYFNVSNTGMRQITAEFVVESPAATSVKVAATSATVELEIVKEGANALIEFSPIRGASCKFTALDSASASLLACASLYQAEHAEHADGSFSQGAECSVKFTEDLIGSSIYLSVAVKSSSYPVSVRIQVTQIANIKNTTTALKATETLSPFADQTGKQLTEVPFDGSATLYFDTTNGFYRLGSAQGPVVVVKLTQKSGRFNLNGGLVYLEEGNERMSANPYLVETTSAEDKADLTKGNTYDDYRILLRGFGAYDYEPNNSGGYTAVKPVIAEQNYYAKYVNSDGVYPLTKELEAFLKGFAKNYADSIVSGAEEGCEWLFACYYYTDETESGETDVIVGSYESTDGFTLTVSKDGTYSVAEASEGGSVKESGTWEKTGENTYTFTWTASNAVYNITRNAQTGALTWVDPESTENSEPYGVFEVPTPDAE